MIQRKKLPTNPIRLECTTNQDVEEQRDPWSMINGQPLFMYEHELISSCGDKKADFSHIDELLALGISVNCRDDKGNTPLMTASRIDNAKLVQFLISRGADVNATNKYNETALKLACGTNYEANLHIAAIKILLKYHADPNIVPINGESPLIASCRDPYKNPEKVVKLLLAAGADPEKSSVFGDTPLLIASCLNHLSVVRILLDRKVKIDVLNKRGETVLTRVSKYQSDRDDVMYLLLKAGADYQKTDAHGKTASDYYPSISRLIEKANKASKSPSEGQSIRHKHSLFKVGTGDNSHSLYELLGNKFGLHDFKHDNITRDNDTITVVIPYQGINDDTAGDCINFHISETLNSFKISGMVVEVKVEFSQDARNIMTLPVTSQRELCRKLDKLPNVEPPARITYLK